MKAINFYLIVEKVKEEPKKIAGLILTEKTDVDNRYVKAKVISTGDQVKGIKENDVVYFDKHAGHGITFDDTLYHVIKHGDVVIVE